MKRRLILPISMTAAGIAVLAVTVASFTRSSPVATTTHQVGSSPVTTVGEYPASAATEQSIEKAAKKPAADPTAPGTSTSTSPSKPLADVLATTITRAQRRLHDAPSDEQTWTDLGAAYLKSAEITGNPAFYPRAEGAFDRSLALDPPNNWQAMTGLGALANARNDFARGIEWGRRAVLVNPNSASAYAVLDSALTEVGDYPAADAAARRLLELEPGSPALARLARHLDERGDTISARQMMLRAVDEAREPAQVCAARRQLGDLAFDAGDPWTALQQYQLGLAADPTSSPARAGRAKAEVALGRRGAALHDYATVIARTPLPQYLLENAELLLSLGREDEAERQFTLLTAAQQRLVTGGVLDDLAVAVAEADHGSATVAVRHAQTEWARRKSGAVADALGWALHRAGRDREAFEYATRANRLSQRNATHRYHLGMIQLALGRRTEARRHLGAALMINPYFSVLQAPAARRALAATRTRLTR